MVLLVSSLNEGLDLTRLLVFPIARRDLVVSILLGTLFDYPTYIMAPVLLAALVTWGISPALPIVALGLLLAYCHMVIASQLVVTVFGGILQSRRFRDLAIILASLFGASCYFIQIGLQGVGERGEHDGRDGDRAQRVDAKRDQAADHQVGEERPGGITPEPERRHRLQGMA